MNEESPPKTRGGHYLYGRGDRATYVAYRRWHPSFFNEDGTVKPEYREELGKRMEANRRDEPQSTTMWQL